MVFEPVVAGETCMHIYYGMVDTRVTAPPLCPSLAARRAARSASKRASLLPQPMLPVLESIPEPAAGEPADDSAHQDAHPSRSSSSSDTDGVQRVEPRAERFASHRRRPREPYAFLADRSQWKVRTFSCFSLLPFFSPFLPCDFTAPHAHITRTTRAIIFSSPCPGSHSVREIRDNGGARATPHA
jgi:hypothetical protein